MPHVHNVIPKGKVNTLRHDPTRTTMLRKQFQAEIKRRVRELKLAVKDFLVIKDALALKPLPGPRFEKPRFIPTGTTREIPLSNVSPRQYEFKTDPQKLLAFRLWLVDQIDAKMLRAVGGQPGKPWTAKYIESAYKKGLINAYLASRKAQAVESDEVFSRSQEQFLRSSFAQPETLSKVELLSTRSYEDLKGVSDTMATRMNSILAQGMVEGRGAEDIARQMFKEIDGLTRKRALVIARTEIIHAHAEGQLDAFAALGLGDLGVLAEWSTANDNRVCPQCAAMEGKRFKVKDSHGLIPLHPNCRCSWIPWVDIGDAGKLSSDPKVRAASRKRK